MKRSHRLRVPAIAVVATAAYGAFLVGPLMIGFTAQRLSLPTALWLIVVSLIVVAAGSVVLRRAGGASS